MSAVEWVSDTRRIDERCMYHFEPPGTRWAGAVQRELSAIYRGRRRVLPGAVSGDRAERNAPLLPDVGRRATGAVRRHPADQSCPAAAGLPTRRSLPTAPDLARHPTVALRPGGASRGARSDPLGIKSFRLSSRWPSSPHHRCRLGPQSIVPARQPVRRTEVPTRRSRGAFVPVVAHRYVQPHSGSANGFNGSHRIPSRRAGHRPEKCRTAFGCDRCARPDRSHVAGRAV